MPSDKQSTGVEDRKGLSRENADEPGRFIGRNVLILYLGRILSVAVFTAAATIGITFSTTTAGQAISVAAAAIVALLTYHVLVKVFWRE